MIGIKAMAKELGVSSATVSYALNNDPRVADATRKRVLEHAKKVGYVPSSFGRALQSRKSLLLGYLAHKITISYFNEILQGAGEAASDAGYGLLVEFTDGSGESVEKSLKLFKEKRVDGIIATSCTPDAIKQLLELNKTGVPVTLCAQRSYGDLLSTVDNDDIKIGKIAMSHLYELGHRKIAYCFGEMSCIRLQGALEFCMSHKGIEIMRFADSTQLEQALRSDDRPTAVVCYSDNHAVQVVDLARSMGLSVPDDISIVGVDDSPFAALPSYSLTTVAPSKREMGKKCIESVIKKKDTDDVEVTLLDSELIIRNSTKQIVL